MRAGEFRLSRDSLARFGSRALKLGWVLVFAVALYGALRSSEGESLSAEIPTEPAFTVRCYEGPRVIVDSIAIGKPTCADGFFSFVDNETGRVVSLCGACVIRAIGP